MPLFEEPSVAIRAHEDRVADNVRAMPHEAKMKRLYRGHDAPTDPAVLAHLENINAAMLTIGDHLAAIIDRIDELDAKVSRLAAID